jgi:hypothetical protein
VTIYKSPLTTVLSVVQLKVKAFAKAASDSPNDFPPILTQSLSNVPAKMMNAEKRITRPKKMTHERLKRTKKLTLNIQCRDKAIA